MDELTFRDADGVDIFYRRWLPSGTPRATVIVAHGLSEHSNRYVRFADALVAAGYAVSAPDHRGHGRTAKSTGIGRAGPRGMVGVVDDLRQLIEISTSDGRPRPVVLFGHSMGALLAQAFAERYGDFLAALVLCGSPGVNDGVGEFATAIRAAVEGGAGDEPLDALGALSQPFEPARTKFDWLSRDPAEVDAYIADPMCGDDVPPTYGFVAEMMQLAFDATQPAGIARMPDGLPVLLVTGERDVASNDAAQVRELETRLRARVDVDARYYPGARHELLNEINRDEVTADIIGWVDAHVRGDRL